LEVVGRRFLRGGLKKAVELRRHHGSPPSRHVDARCLAIDCLCKFGVAPGLNPRRSFPSANMFLWVCTIICG
jgi:hypothetical protein